MRILLLTQWFEPEPTFKGRIFARALVQRGHQVEVLTGFPNYPAGRLYDGFKLRVCQVEHRDGARIVRVPLYPSHDGSAFRRTLNYVSFATSAALIGPFTVSHPDVIYAYHPPITVGLSGAVLGRFFDCPVVLDVQDLWPESVEASGMMPTSLVRPLDFLCQWVYRDAARVVALSPGMKDRLVRSGLRADHVSHIYNWCDETALRGGRGGELLSPVRRASQFLVVYAGAMGTVQGLGSVLDAAEILLHRSPGVHIVFVGSGVDAGRLRRESTTRGLSNTTFLPQQPISATGELLRSADALLVHLRDLPLFSVTIPSKTQAYMSIGGPIVMAVRGDAADLVARAACGVTCQPEDPASIASGIESLAALSASERNAMGERGRAFYKAELSLECGVSAFEAVFSDAIRAAGSGRSAHGSAC